MDWASLTEKLRRMGVQVGVEKPLDSGPARHIPIDKVVPGRDLANAFGNVFSLLHDYPKEHLHGQQSLCPSLSLIQIAKWANSVSFENPNLEEFVFLDTETTGLSGGTGAMAFMVGVGRFKNKSFVLEQFFLRSPAEEAALLAGLTAFCDSMAAVVTYNGKSFDIPLLNNRFILQGLNSPFVNLPHVDLLHLSRRVWKTRLEQCNLGNVEKRVLGLERSEQEVPGYLVPEIYTQYLRDGNAEALKGVFYHNEIDVLSLAALFSLLADALADPSDPPIKDYQDVTALGRVLEQIGDVENAMSLYQRSAAHPDSGGVYIEPLLLQAHYYKRVKAYEKAVPLWQIAAEANSLEALEELSKYFEHFEKQPGTALIFTEQALTVIGSEPLDHRMQVWKKQFLQRQSRLIRKKQHQSPLED